MFLATEARLFRTIMELAKQNGYYFLISLPSNDYFEENLAYSDFFL